MASSLRDANISCESASMWDISKRMDRILMAGFLEPLVCHIRLARVLRRNPIFDWIVVVSPHRVPIQTLEALRRRSMLVVALLGDEPVGVRKLSTSAQSIFDKVSVADPAWADHLSASPDCILAESWGSCAEIRPTSPYSSDEYVVVGAPYPERISVVNGLLSRGYSVRVVGSDWAGLVKCEVVASMSVPDTMKYVRAERLTIVNIHHLQFRSGLNPQFFDYAANALPQVVLGSRNGFEYAPGSSHVFNSLICRDFDAPPRIEEVAQLAKIVRANFMFPKTIERILL